MYREVTMFEVTEALRLWLSGTPKKRIAAQLGPRSENRAALRRGRDRHRVAARCGTHRGARPRCPVGAPAERRTSAGRHLEPSASDSL